MDKVLKYFPFLAANRFWALVLIGTVMLLNDATLVSDSFMEFVFVVAGGHTLVRTTDRAFEHLGKRK